MTSRSSSPSCAALARRAKHHAARVGYWRVLAECAKRLHHAADVVRHCERKATRSQLWLDRTVRALESEIAKLSRPVSG